jgi:hypothetical protein
MPAVNSVLNCRVVGKRGSYAVRASPERKSRARFSSSAFALEPRGLNLSHYANGEEDLGGGLADIALFCRLGRTFLGAVGCSDQVIRPPRPAARRAASLYRDRQRIDHSSGRVADGALGR